MGHIEFQEPYDYVIRYLDLIEKLTDEQVLLIHNYNNSEDEFLSIQKELFSNQDFLIAAKSNINLFDNNRQGNSKYNVVDKRLKIAKERLQKFESLNLEIQNRLNNIIRERNKSLSGDEDFQRFIIFDLRVLGLLYNPSEGRASSSNEFNEDRCTLLARNFLKYIMYE